MNRGFIRLNHRNTIEKYDLVAERVGLGSNLLHLMDILIICFHYKSELAPTAIPDAFNKDRWLH